MWTCTVINGSDPDLQTDFLAQLQTCLIIQIWPYLYSCLDLATIPGSVLPALLRYCGTGLPTLLWDPPCCLTHLPQGSSPALAALWQEGNGMGLASYWHMNFMKLFFKSSNLIMSQYAEQRKVSLCFQEFCKWIAEMAWGLWTSCQLLQKFADFWKEQGSNWSNFHTRPGNPLCVTPFYQTAAYVYAKSALKYGKNVEKRKWKV